MAPTLGNLGGLIRVGKIFLWGNVYRFGRICKNVIVG